MENVTEGKVLVLFDGVCVLCNGLVQRLIQLDKKDVFRYASLQSEFAVQLLNKFQLVDHRLDKIESMLVDIKQSLGNKKSDTLKTYLNWAGVVIVALLGAVLHLITK